MACDLKQMKTEFLLAAEKFLQCEHYLNAATCLRNVKEVDLATQLYEKLGLVIKLFFYYFMPLSAFSFLLLSYYCMYIQL
jgi:hypothetical protein